MKRARLRPQAGAELIESTRHCATAGSPALAERLFDAAIAAPEPTDRMPGLGSPRLGQLCEIPGLRCWRVNDLPMPWLCFEAGDPIDVVRLSKCAATASSSSSAC